MNHLSKVRPQASEEPSKVSDRPVSGSRIEKETLAGSHQTADAKELQHLHKGPHPHPHHGLGARLTSRTDTTPGPTHSDVLKFHHLGSQPGGVRDLFLTLEGWPSNGAGPKTLPPWTS